MAVVDGTDECTIEQPSAPAVAAWRARLQRAIPILACLNVATAAYLTAFALRFDFEIPARLWSTVAATSVLAVGMKLASFWWFGIFARSWRHASVRDLEDILIANLAGSGLLLAALALGPGLAGFPRSIIPLDLLLCTTAMGGARLAMRLARDRQRRRTVRRIDTIAVIVGAGSTGMRLLEEIQSRTRLRLEVVGFVDDDVRKHGLRMGGVPVLGAIDALPALVQAHDVTQVLIAIPSAPGTLVRRIVQHCRAAGVSHRVVPTLGELAEGRVMVTQMREVKVDDLLAREPVRLDHPRVRGLVRGKRVLVTGAAGSIGSELCRQLVAYEPATLVLYDRHENGMFALENELRARHPEAALVPVLGDVLLEDQLDAIFAAHRPELVFHAAAYKHVPLAERNVLEAVRNNVFGTMNVARAAMRHGTIEMVLVSTDKAVRPTSVMGVTKRVAELAIMSLPTQPCGFVAVRFGNVLGSNGSVVPVFREQIARGGPVTVTDPEMIRYFMTIPEASQLILQAATLRNGREIFILDMGEPVKIADLARNMIRLSGFEPDVDIPIEFTGVRPGEKMYEELVDDGEDLADTSHDRICVVRALPPLLPPAQWLPALADCVERGDARGALTILVQLVPGYQPGAVAWGRDGTTGAERVAA